MTFVTIFTENTLIQLQRRRRLKQSCDASQHAVFKVVLPLWHRVKGNPVALRVEEHAHVAVFG